MRSAATARRLLAPAVSLTVLVVAAGTGSLAATSFGVLPLFGSPRFSVAGYTEAAADLGAGVGESFVIAAASTAVAVVVGLSAALSILASVAGARAIGALGAAVVAIPHLVGAVSIGLLLSDGGVLSRALGVGEGTWPELVGGAGHIAVIAEFAWKESAFVALLVVASLSGRLVELTEAASMLGADRGQRLWRVILPAAAPAAAAGATIVFVYTIGAYEVAWLLGRAYPEPLPVMAYRLFTSMDLAARPQAAAAGMTTIGMALLAAGAAGAWLRRLGAAR